MDYNHKRANSELASITRSINAAAKQRNMSQPARDFATGAVDWTNQCFGTNEFVQDYYMRGPDAPSAYSNGRLDDSRLNHDHRDAGWSSTNNCHFRSQSHESPYNWSSGLGMEAASEPFPTSRRYGDLGQNRQLAPSMMPRRSSEDSVSSNASTSAGTADQGCAWSASTTPESLSPTTPKDSLVLQSPPEKPPSGVVSPEAGTDTVILPAKAYQLPATSRPARSRACSRSAPKRFQNTPIDAPVPEEEEQAENRCTGRARQNRERAVVALVDTAVSPGEGRRPDGGATVPSLHQRRQQRQQSVSAQTQPKQLARPRLSTMPPLPLQSQATRTSPAPLHRGLDRLASRSLPQLRGLAGPPPPGPLPSLPPVPAISPLFPLVPASPTVSTPTVSPGINSRPPPPDGPPPAAPAAAAASAAATTSTAAESSTTLTTSSTSETIKPKEERSQERNITPPSWQDELQRHKMYLQQFPAEPCEPPHDRPRLSRAHRSLGNLRARARARSLAHAAAVSPDEAVSAEPFSAMQHISQCASRGLRTGRPSTAKTTREWGVRLDEPLPPLPQVDTPHVSVFEEDSDDEGDTVRKFVRNLFTRRTRSGEVPSASVHAREPSLGSKETAAAMASYARAGDANSHNNRKKNYSTSSSFSVATTVGASTIVSTTTTLASTNTEASEVDYYLEDDHASTSPRTSTDQARPSQKGPLLSRMFVRRSR
ncbi:hypothetical protein SPI_04015 [Niveomyces insectorum RCEF 264]|uniref:Uncharacterized protein n=1 Tax=Niveomyces insectorum RCEF 264 TaxID=1081102 RepID=A0A167VCW1_9HYPO|nr:hypothetical protein SPI_04015 [Niveomyces insectorum RCEF 264]